MISLNPYIPEQEGLGPKSNSMMITKLNQIATVSGMSGEGFDNRFIITAHAQELESSVTATQPPKYAVKLSVNIYIGDGIDGTMYSSAAFEVKGIGDTKDDAYSSAFKKIQPRSAEMQRCVEEGKQRIIDYYDKNSANIISAAEAAAGAAKYDEAINMLFAIPMACADYEKAQTLIAKYGGISLDNSNQAIVSSARNAWSASPNADGAAKAEELLNQLNAPSGKILADANALKNEIASRLKLERDREWKFQQQQQANEHNAEMARIKSEKEQNIALVKAAASVAKARIANQPRVVYHVHWW